MSEPSSYSLKCHKSSFPIAKISQTHTDPSLNLSPLVLPRSVSSIPEIFACRMNRCFVRIIYSGRKKGGGGDENEKQLAIQLALSKFQVRNPLFVFILFLFFLPTLGFQSMKRNTSCEAFLEPSAGLRGDGDVGGSSILRPGTGTQSCLFAFQHRSFVFCPPTGSTSSNSR